MIEGRSWHQSKVESKMMVSGFFNFNNNPQSSMEYSMTSGFMAVGKSARGILDRSIVVRRSLEK